MKQSPGSTLAEFERSLSAVMRLLADRGTRGDIALRSGYDLPPASWSLLEHLDARGDLRVSDIAACHGVDVSSVTPRLKALENAGLVARQRLAADARVSMISITSQGIEALQSVHSARGEILAQVVGDTDPAQLAAAAQILSCLAEHLSAIDAERPELVPSRPLTSVSSRSAMRPARGEGGRQ